MPTNVEIKARVRDFDRLKTRIEMDAVEGLGFFMELEVVLKDGQDIGQGATIANDLMDKLGIHPADLVQGAHIDLLERPGS